MIYLRLADGRIFGFPAGRFRRLRDAPDALLDKVQIEVNGYALRWEELDEDISIEGIIAGRCSAESAESLSRWFNSRQSSKQSAPKSRPKPEVGRMIWGSKCFAEFDFPEFYSASLESALSALLSTSSSCFTSSL